MFKQRSSAALRWLAEGLSWRQVTLIVTGAAICSFGIHNIHQQVGITEGGVIGLMLLIEHWLGLPPAVITTVLDLTCYALSFFFLGGRFIKISVLSTLSVSLFYEIWERFPRMLPDLSHLPLVAALAGGAFVGVGVGLIVRQGGSSGGDDALALTISHVTHWRLSRSYLFTDLVVLGLSLSYIPVGRIFFSIVTVMTSSVLIDRIQDFSRHRSGDDPGDASGSDDQTSPA